MPTASALEFQRKFGRFQHEARREPVEITRHGRRAFVLMSAQRYDWLRASARRGHRTDDAAGMAIGAVERAEMDAEHKPLDDLLTQPRSGGASRPEAGAGRPLRLPVDA